MSILDDVDWHTVFQCMKLQRRDLLLDAEVSHDDNCPFALRLLNHFIAYNIRDRNSVEVFHSMMARTKQIRFDSLAKKDEVINTIEGSCVVAKEPRSCGGTIYKVWNQYFQRSGERDYDIGSDELVLKEDGYYRNDKRVDSISLLLDISLSGHAATNSIKTMLFDNHDESVPAISFKCEGELVTMRQIIDRNSIRCISIIVLSASELAKNTIHNLLLETKKRYEDRDLVLNEVYGEVFHDDDYRLTDEMADFVEQKYKHSDTPNATIQSGIGRNAILVVREFNQNKKTIFPADALDSTHIASIFCLKNEFEKL